VTSLVWFFVLAYLVTWPLALLVERSIVFGLIGLFGPAFAAAVVARAEGKARLRELGSRAVRWRAPAGAYLLALTIPIAVSAVVAGAAKVLTPAATIGVQPVNALSLVLFVLVAGEELGWRGFALPRLLARSSPWTASVGLGVLWGFWHLPLFFVAGTPHSQMALPAFIGYTVGLSLALTWYARLTAGSALLATLFHGVTNAFGLTANGVSPYTRSWIAGIAWLVAGVLLLALGDRNRARAAAIP